MKNSQDVFIIKTKDQKSSHLQGVFFVFVPEEFQKPTDQAGKTVSKPAPLFKTLKILSEPVQADPVFVSDLFLQFQKFPVNFLKGRQALEQGLFFRFLQVLVAGDIDDQGFDFIMVDQDGTNPGFYPLLDRRVSLQKIRFKRGSTRTRNSGAR